MTVEPLAIDGIGMKESEVRKSTKIDFESLWNKLSSDHSLNVENAGDEVNQNSIIRIPKGKLKVRVGNYGVGSFDSPPYADVVCVSRHFVSKPIYTIEVSRNRGGLVDGKFTVKTTADHTCMVVAKNPANGCPLDDGEEGFFRMSRISAKDLRTGHLMCVDMPETFFGKECCDVAMEVTDIKVDENKDGQWVYDLEVDSDRHVYFANGILVHNSQFINLSPVTKRKCIEDDVDENTIFSELPDETREKVVKEAYHIVDLANANVERLVNAECHTTQGNILHYSLEYIAAEGMYFKKKHYIVRKIISDDLPCNKFKYSGISVKKAEIPVAMKDFLKSIFESTMTKKWSEADFRKEVQNAFNKFITLDWGDISYYKKYRTVKRTVSLTESEKGAGVHARSANFYNQLIEKLGLAGRYPKIGVGDEFRYSYVLPTNEYGMNCIAFKGVFPDEFRSIFKPDYETMFNKIFTKSLEHYVEIMNFKTADPTRREEDPSFSLF